MRVNVVKTNFTGGVIDPLLYGRMDTPRYQNGCEKILNAFVLSTGGCTRAWGTKFVDSAGAGISVKSAPFFILKKDVSPPVIQGYRIQFRSDGKIRFYTNNALILSGGNPYEINSPFPNTDLRRIRFEQFDNVLYLVHPDVAPQKLTRATDTSWTIEAVPFTMPAAQSVSGITRSGSIATATTAANHGYSTGDLITIAGAAQSEYNGTFQITKTGDTTFTYTVTGTPVTPATGTITAQKVHWHANFGYPPCITFFEQRGIYGGTKTHPQTCVGSKNGEPTNLQTGTNDSDAFSFTLAQATAPVLHLIASSRQIGALTGREEILIQGSADKALTPTNVQIKRQTGYGTIDTVAPQAIAGEILFTTKYGKKVRLLGYKYDIDKYTAPEQSIIAAHLLAAGAIADMAVSTEPYSIVWIVTNDGKLVIVVFDKDQDVIAWSHCETDGVIKEVTVVPGMSQDQVWLTVQRTIAGTTYTYNEYFDAALNTHCAYTGTDANGKALWTGLNYIEGKTVDVLADGVVMPQQIVQSGLTLPRNAKAVEIGLHYDSEVVDLPVAFQTPIGFSRGMAVSISEIHALLYNSLGCEINGEIVPFRKFGTAILDMPIAPFTGLKKVNVIGWNECRVTIKQTQPLPFTVLAIIKKVTVND